MLAASLRTKCGCGFFIFGLLRVVVITILLYHNLYLNFIFPCHVLIITSLSSLLVRRRQQKKHKPKILKTKKEPWRTAKKSNLDLNAFLFQMKPVMKLIFKVKSLSTLVGKGIFLYFLDKRRPLSFMGKFKVQRRLPVVGIKYEVIHLYLQRP